MSRWVSLSVAIVGSFLALTPVASAAGHLDPTFGKGGVVDVNKDLGSGSLGAIAVAPDRSIYFTETSPVCYRGGCPSRVGLRHYLAGGSLDHRFGEPVIARAMEGESLLVDPTGEPVVAWERHSGGGGIAVRRFHPGGAVDHSFGNSGTAILDCGCFFESLVLAPGGDLIVRGYWEPKRKRKDARMKSKWFFARLGPNGRLVRSFGRGGEIWIPRRAYYSPDAVAPVPGKSFLGVLLPRGYDASAPAVMRLSNRGGLDRRYFAATRRSLTGLYQTSRESFGWEGISLIPRSRGSIDVYGLAYGGGVAVRLLRNGRRDRSFGHNGVTEFPFELNDVVSDGPRGALAVGYKSGRYSVLRVGGRGRIDHRFGRVALPGAYNEYGLGILHSGRNAAVVVARGESVCRFGCPSEPKLYRVLR